MLRRSEIENLLSLFPEDEMQNFIVSSGMKTTKASDKYELIAIMSSVYENLIANNLSNIVKISDYHSVKFIWLPVADFNAFHSTEDGSQYIIFCQGLLNLVSFYYEAILIHNAYKADFDKKVAINIMKNKELSNAFISKNLTFIDNCGGFIQENGVPWSFSQEFFLMTQFMIYRYIEEPFCLPRISDLCPPDLIKTFKGIYKGILNIESFIYLHEISHGILGHLGSNHSLKNNQSAVFYDSNINKSQELDADSRAIQLANFDLNVLSGGVSFFSMLSDYEIFREISSDTHPHAVDRMENILNISNHGETSKGLKDILNICRMNRLEMVNKINFTEETYMRYSRESIRSTFIKIVKEMVKLEKSPLY
ncbi:MAG: hypothetical protein H7829_07980 [Magnetococcus sp. THC-1_WYH]